MINSRDIADLRPDVQAKARAFLSKCAEEGIDVLITSTYRDHASQDALYAQGRTIQGKKVTNAKAGQSFHNYRVAFDFCPILNGKCQWADVELFTMCGEIGESVGLEWAGRWTRFKELAHLQQPGLSIADLKA